MPTAIWRLAVEVARRRWRGGEAGGGGVGGGGGEGGEEL